MVAITIILAAVIGAFVLGFGADTEAAPNTNIGISGTADAGNGDNGTLDLEINHNGGDTIEAGNLNVILVDSNNNETRANGVFDDEFTVADRETATLEVDNDTLNNVSDADSSLIDVRIVHTPSDSLIVDRTINVGETVAIGENTNFDFD